MKRLVRIGVAAVLSAVSAMAYSQAAGGPNPEAQAKASIETRQGLFKLINNQNGPITAMLIRNQGEFNAEIVARNATRIQVLAEMIPELYNLDTRQFKATRTLALDGIWNSQADFKAKADGLSTAAAALVAAAKTGDKAASTKAAMEVGKACGACHDNYRAKP